jgi:hypothetical protein
MQELFPSANFTQRAESAHARTTRAKVDLEALQSRLEKFERNRTGLELSGRDPDLEIRRVRDEIRKAETEIAHSQEAMRLLFSEERSRFTLLRQKIWTEQCAELVDASATKLTTAAAALRSISDAINAHKSLSDFDAGIVEINRLVSLFGLPGNCSLASSDGLTLTFQSAVRSAFANCGLAKAIEDLRVAVGLDAPRSGILTQAAQEFGRRDQAGAQ